MTITLPNGDIEQDDGTIIAGSNASAAPNNPKAPATDAPDPNADNTPTNTATVAGDTAPTDPTKAGGTAPVTPTSNTADLPPALQQNADNIKNPTLPTGATQNVVKQQVGAGEITDPNKYNLKSPDKLNAQTGAAMQVAGPDKLTAAQVTAQTIGADNAPKVSAAQGQIGAQDLVQAQSQDGLSPALQKTLDDFNTQLAAIGVDPNATVQEQYKKLTDFSAGMPGWAQSAITLANQTMAARGLGNSSVAGGAITTAVLQAALPIAQQDAQVFQTMQLKKLDSLQAATFLKAGYIANLDTQNLNNRQQAAVINAQQFLNMDMANLSNEQQAAVIDTQNRLQVMMSDQSAENAAKQFNATSQNQTNQFYASLATSVKTFNAAQNNAMTQFNAGQTNAVAQFNANLQSTTDQFNAKNQTLIDQSNTNYLRNINTNNTAAINSANLVNSQNLVNISNSAMANQIQLIRDQAAFSFQAGENEKDRAQQGALMQLQNTQWFQQYNHIQANSFVNAVGGFLRGLTGDALHTWLNNGYSAPGGSGSGPNTDGTNSQVGSGSQGDPSSGGA